MADEQRLDNDQEIFVQADGEVAINAVMSPKAFAQLLRELNARKMDMTEIPDQEGQERAPQWE